MRNFACGLTFVLILVSNSRSDAQEWTRFHGPNGTGVSEATSIPAVWSKSDYNWKVKLPGIGHSSPVLWGNKIFLLSADPQDATRYVLCLDAADGRQLWKRAFKSSPHNLHPRSSYASSTPTVDADHVYVAWAAPKQMTLKAFTHEGDEVWSLDLGRWVGQWGFGTSPMLYQDLVILSASKQAQGIPQGQVPGKSSIMAFDRKTGKQRWRTPRKSTRVCYSVPCVYRPPRGAPELICCSTGNGIFSLDPKTGNENWAIDVFKMRTISSPIMAGGLIFGSTGSGKGGNYVVAIRPGKSAQIAYKFEGSQKAPYVPTLVARGDLLFLWSEKGIVSCLDAPTGKQHWQQRIGGNYNGSPIRVGNKIYCIDEGGLVMVIAAERKYRLLGKNALGEASRSTPAVSGGRLYLRTYAHLFSVGGKSR